jgi:nucleoside-diphosphate-sugar epimerase
MARDWGSWDEFYNTNVAGTLNVLEAARKNRITNIILTGTISSYGEEDSGTIKNEDSPDNSHYKYFLDRIFPCKMNYYRDSKAIATRKAVEYCRKHSMSVNILEPVWVFGENEFHTGFYDYYKLVKPGMRFFPGCSKNKFHQIYVGDLVRAYYTCYRKNPVGINRIIIGNAEAGLMSDFYELVCREIGVRKPSNLPKFITYPAGFVLELVSTILSLKNPPLLTRGRVNMFYDNIEYSVRKAEQLLDFKCQYTIEDGVIRTIEWYKKLKLI